MTILQLWSRLSVPFLLVSKCSFGVDVGDGLAGIEGLKHLVTHLAGGDEVSADVLDDVRAATAKAEPVAVAEALKVVVRVVGDDLVGFAMALADSVFGAGREKGDAIRGQADLAGPR